MSKRVQTCLNMYKRVQNVSQNVKDCPKLSKNVKIIHSPNTTVPLDTQYSQVVLTVLLHVAEFPHFSDIHLRILISIGTNIKSNPFKYFSINSLFASCSINVNMIVHTKNPQNLQCGISSLRSLPYSVRAPRLAVAQESPTLNCPELTLWPKSFGLHRHQPTRGGLPRFLPPKCVIWFQTKGGSGLLVCFLCHNSAPLGHHWAPNGINFANKAPQKVPNLAPTTGCAVGASFGGQSRHTWINREPVGAIIGVSFAEWAALVGPLATFSSLTPPPDHS